jgi:hypothetical protein
VLTFAKQAVHATGIGRLWIVSYDRDAFSSEELILLLLGVLGNVGQHVGVYIYQISERVIMATDEN